MYISVPVYPLQKVYMLLLLNQERPCLCSLSEYFCTDVLHFKVIY